MLILVSCSLSPLNQIKALLDSKKVEPEKKGEIKKEWRKIEREIEREENDRKDREIIEREIEREKKKVEERSRQRERQSNIKLDRGKNEKWQKERLSVV